MKGLLVVVFAVVSSACGGKSPPPAAPQTGGAAPATGSAAAPATVAAALGEDECDKLLDHTIQIEFAERPADQHLDASEQAAVRKSVRDEFLVECRKLKRDTYTCAMAGKTTAEMQACDQASRSSSTSNSNVAPGGITPAAPRSP